MIFHSLFFVVASLCAVVYSISTILNGWLLMLSAKAHPANQDVTATMQNDPRSILRSWLVFSCIFLLLIALSGIAARVFTQSPEFALLGFVFCFIFIISELLCRSIEIFAVRRFILTQGSDGSGLTSNNIIDIQIKAFSAMMEGLYFIMSLSYLIGSVLYGIASLSEMLSDRLVSIALFINALRLVLKIVEMHGGQRRLQKFNSLAFIIFVPILYFAIGIWLWPK